MKTTNLQKKSHETLLKLLNNIGIVGAILAAIADLIIVIIFVVGLKFEIKSSAAIVFSIINAIVGIMINVLLRYQGQKYAEIENEEICSKYYRKKIKEKKHYISMGLWQAIQAVKDFVMKGCSTVFSICGVIYLSIEGSKNPTQILITIVTLIMFACFGLVNMNSSYTRFYNEQIPYMELKIKEKENQEKGENENAVI